MPTSPTSARPGLGFLGGGDHNLLIGKLHHATDRNCDSRPASLHALNLPEGHGCQRRKELTRRVDEIP